MTTTRSSTPATTGPARVAGNLMILVGAIGIVLTLIGKAFVEPAIPPVVVYANVTACVLEAALGLGVIQGRRPAWAFGVAIWGTFIVINLLALPSMIEAGMPVGVFSAVVAGGRFLWGIPLLMGRKQF